jgi:hypothetical protein
MKQIEDTPLCEDAVLQQVLLLSSQQGIALPVRGSHSDPGSHSCLSINTAMDDSEHMAEILWDSLCRMLRKQYLQRLNLLPIAKSTPVLSTSKQERLHCVQSIAVLFPDAWSSYSSMRVQHISQLVDRHLRPLGRFHQCVEGFSQLTGKLLIIIQEDFDLINSGVFGSEPGVIKGLHQLYCDPLLDEISSIVELLQYELPSKSGTPKRKPSAGSRRSAEVAPEPSEGLLGLRTHMKKNLSGSLDSLISRSDDPFTDLQALSPFALGPLAEMVSSLLCLENEIIALQNLLEWDIAGAARHSKKDLKGTVLNDLLCLHSLLFL